MEQHFLIAKIYGDFQVSTDQGSTILSTRIDSLLISGKLKLCHGRWLISDREGVAIGVKHDNYGQAFVLFVEAKLEQIACRQVEKIDEMILKHLEKIDGTISEHTR